MPRRVSSFSPEDPERSQAYAAAYESLPETAFMKKYSAFAVAREALRLAAMKLPVKCRFVEREDW